MAAFGSLGLIAVGAVLSLVGVELVLRGGRFATRKLGLPEFIFGLTVAAIVTNAPELSINALYAMRGGGDVVVGNVVGSNLFNVLAVLGFAALAGTMQVSREVYWTTLPLLLLVSGAVYPLAWDRRVGRFDGVLLIIAGAAFLIFSVRRTWEQGPSRVESPSPPLRSGREGDRTWAAAVRSLTVGLALVSFGALVVVWGGESLDTASGRVASTLSQNPTLFGVSLLALCTSLPELALGISAMIRKEKQLLAGAIFGSCILNLSLGLGAASLLGDRIVASQFILESALLLSLAATAGCLGLIALPAPLSRIFGGLMFALYFVFAFWLAFETLGHPLARPFFWIVALGSLSPIPVATVTWVRERWRAV